MTAFNNQMAFVSLLQW